MSLNNIAIISPGDMGSAIGRLLVSNGANVYTCLANRSTRTKALAELAGIIDLPTFNDLVRTVDVVLSMHDVILGISTFHRNRYYKSPNNNHHYY